MGAPRRREPGAAQHRRSERIRVGTEDASRLINDVAGAEAGVLPQVVRLDLVAERAGDTVPSEASLIRGGVDQRHGCGRARAPLGVTAHACVAVVTNRSDRLRRARRTGDLSGHHRTEERIASRVAHRRRAPCLEEAHRSSLLVFERRRRRRSAVALAADVAGGEEVMLERDARRQRRMGRWSPGIARPCIGQPRVSRRSRVRRACIRSRQGPHRVGARGRPDQRNRDRCESRPSHRLLFGIKALARAQGAGAPNRRGRGFRLRRSLDPIAPTG